MSQNQFSGRDMNRVQNPEPIYAPPGGDLANVPLNPPSYPQLDPAAGGGQMYQPPAGSGPRLHPSVHANAQGNRLSQYSY